MGVISASDRWTALCRNTSASGSFSAQRSRSVRRAWARSSSASATATSIPRGPPDQYWINGRLRISADEQVEFLRRFYARDLGITPEHHETVSHALIEPPGGVQNATGIHTLSSNWKKGNTLSARTGGGMALADPEVRVSWLVGRLSAGGKDYIFASNIVRRGQLDPVEAARQAFKTFRQRRLID